MLLRELRSSFFVLPQVPASAVFHACRKAVHLLLLGLPLLLLAHCARPLNTQNAATEPTVVTDAYTASILEWQEELNAHYRDPERSPLPAADRAIFTAHPFFTIDSSYRVKATLDFPNRPIVLEMPTSSGSIKTFRVWALALFELGGKQHSIQILQPAGRIAGPANYLFIPFQDKTSGRSTYGGGRYIDLPLPEGEVRELLIDFNRAYHPYCAYTDGYNCPIPPQENRIDVPIPAGIRL